MIDCIFVKSRKVIEAVMPKINKPSIIISIRDPNKPKANITSSGYVREVLFLDFDDWDRPDPKEQLMTDDQAREIASFVTRYEKNDQSFDLYVNCEAGMSRSAGVAAAISKALRDDDEFFFKVYYPNMLVYRKVFNALVDNLTPNKELDNVTDDVLETIKNQELE